MSTRAGVYVWDSLDVQTRSMVERFDVIVGCRRIRDGRDVLRKMEKLEFYVNLQDKLNYW